MSNQQPTIPLFGYEKAMLRELNTEGFGNLIDMFEKACHDYKGRTAYTAMGRDISFEEVERKSAAFAAYLLTGAGLAPASRIAIQLPNIGHHPGRPGGVDSTDRGSDSPYRYRPRYYHQRV